MIWFKILNFRISWPLINEKINSAYVVFDSMFVRGEEGKRGIELMTVSRGMRLKS